jgi:hypothetical protein
MRRRVRLISLVACTSVVALTVPLYGAAAAGATTSYVTITGIVTAGGSAVPAATVRFVAPNLLCPPAGCVTVKADESGAFAMHVVRGSQGILLVSFDDRFTHYSAFEQGDETEDVTYEDSTQPATFTSDTTLNVATPAMPALVTTTVQLVDAGSNPVPGTELSVGTFCGGTNPQRQCLLHAGAWALESSSNPANYGDFAASSNYSETCLTDANGMCTFNGPSGISASTSFTMPAPTGGYQGTATSGGNQITFGQAGTDVLAEPPPPSDPINVTGTVTDGSSNPIAGASIQFGLAAHACSTQGCAYTTTDGSGTYALHLQQGTTGTVIVGVKEGVDHVSTVDGTHDGGSLTYGISSQSATFNADTTVDLQVPTLPSIDNETVQFVDPEGVPVAGMTVEAQRLCGITSSGIPCLDTASGWAPQSASNPAHYGEFGAFVNQFDESCLTDASGDCTFAGPDGMTYALSYTWPSPPSGYEAPSAAGGSTLAFSPTGASVHEPLPKADAATISGTVTDGGGTPVAGATVLFGNAPGVCPADGCAATTTDGAGSYTLHVVPGERSALIVGEPSPFPKLTYFDSLAPATYTGAATVPLNVPTEPATTTLSLHLEDGLGRSVADTDVQVALCGAAPFCVDSGGTWSAETPQHLTYGQSGAWIQGNQIQTCTTDASGDCSIQGPAGMPVTLSYSWVPPAGYEGVGATESQTTAFGSTDSSVTLQYQNYAIVGSGGQAVALVSPNGTALSSESLVPVSAPDIPSGALAVNDAIAYTVTHVSTGGTAKVVIDLPPTDQAPTAIYKLVNGVYVDVTSLSSISGSELTLNLTDGGTGDEDGKANGTIVDPLVPVSGVRGTSTVLLRVTPAVKRLSSTREKVTLTIKSKGARGAVKGTLVLYDGTHRLSSFTMGTTTKTVTVIVKAKVTHKLYVKFAGSATYRPTCSSPVRVR